MSSMVLGSARTTESVVTITVQITVTGDELPPAASRLISDLEALGATRTGHHVQFGSSAPHGAALQRASVLQSPARTLRLVETASDASRVRRIGRPGSPIALSLCTGSRLVLRDEEPVPLTRREYDLFQFFCEHPRRVFSRAQLLRQVWGYDMVGTERTVDVHVRRLRVKLGDCASIITTVRGVGYRLDDEAPVEIVVRED